MILNDVRSTALACLTQVLRQGKSLDAALTEASEQINPNDTALLKFLCYGLLREYESLHELLAQLLSKPLAAKAFQLHLLLLLGLFQLKNSRIPAYAIINESVKLCKRLKNPYASGLVNAVLRRFEREQAQLLAALAKKPGLNHPQFLIEKFQQHYPSRYREIIDNNNIAAPMHLRINQRQTTTKAYLSLLETAGIEARTINGFPDALTLTTPIDVQHLPYFTEGWVSVQDLAAQMTPYLLQLQDNLTVLDACAAPGGKSCHMLEVANIDLCSLDISAKRLEKIRENLARLNLTAQLITADATAFADKNPQLSFDRILIDAPCSGTGVIRRHPDIKFLRRKEDIAKLHAEQVALITKLASLVKPGGLLLYSTCSILPEENDLSVSAACGQLPHFATVMLTENFAPLGAAKLIQATQYGYQFLPNPESHDGFYYALLRRLV